MNNEIQTISRTPLLSTLPEATTVEYFNEPQTLAWLVDAKESYYIWGRGTGKTRGVLAPKIRRDAIEMPRCQILNVGETYQQILTRTLPSLITGLEAVGLYDNVHFVVGKKPDKKAGFKEPFERPKNYDNTLTFRWGSCLNFISQDKKGSSNGLNTDVHIADEVKYLDYEQYLEETYPTLRANRQRWGHLHFHRSICMTTSMPTMADAKWILKKEDEMDPELVNLIIHIQIELNNMKMQYEQLEGGASPQKVSLLADIRRWENYLTEKRKKCVYVSYASSLDNAHVLGEDYIADMRRTMPDFIFNTEILNIKPQSVEGGFYNGLSIQRHGYNMYDNNYLESRGFKVLNDTINCLQDADIDRSLPLRIGLDYGDRINCLTVAQQLPDNTPAKKKIRFLKNLYVTAPAMLADLANQFIEYYRPLPRKEVYMNADPQGTKGVANSYDTWNQDFANRLRKAGWKVIDVSRRKYPAHIAKYLLWNRLLNSNGEEWPRVEFNKHNCKELLISMLQAPAEEKRGRIGKDKKSEQNKNTPQEEATHLSDTADMVVCDLLEDRITNRPEFMPMM